MRCILLVWLSICVLVAGCSNRDKNWKETFPVSGEVYVDGQPAEGVSVTLHPNKGMDVAQPTITSTVTGPGGRFALSTYKEGDGAPAGDYSLTFEWGELNKMSMTYGGDKFKGKYNDPKKSEFSAKVAAPSVDLGRINLTTK